MPVPSSATISELRRAVGPWPWRIHQIEVCSGKAISQEMTLWMALVVFAGYELGGKHSDERPGSQSQGDRHL